MTHRFDPSTLREYDIRGIVGKTLGPEDAHAIGRSFGTLIRRAGGTRVAVGRDGRASSPQMETALVDGLRQSGVSVVRVGLGPTPMLYYAEAVLEVDGGIQVTGSHNPAEYNGFKMCRGTAAMAGDEIQQLRDVFEEGRFRFSYPGPGDDDSDDVSDAILRLRSLSKALFMPRDENSIILKS